MILIRDHDQPARPQARTIIEKFKAAGYEPDPDKPVGFCQFWAGVQGDAVLLFCTRVKELPVGLTIAEDETVIEMRAMAEGLDPRYSDGYAAEMAQATDAPEWLVRVARGDVLAVLDRLMGLGFTPAYETPIVGPMSFLASPDLYLLGRTRLDRDALRAVPGVLEAVPNEPTA